MTNNGKTQAVKTGGYTTTKTDTYHSIQCDDCEMKYSVAKYNRLWEFADRHVCK